MRAMTMAAVPRTLPQLCRVSSRHYIFYQQRSFSADYRLHTSFSPGVSSTLLNANPSIIQLQSESPRRKTRRPKRIIVAVTGAIGAPLAVSLLKRLGRLGVETHLILSKWGAATLRYELDTPNNTSAYLSSLAAVTYSAVDVSAPPSSGSFRSDGMVIVPCSMKTLAAVHSGYDADLISRAAGVALKERRRLLLVARETPLSDVHLKNMLGVSRAGAVIFPPVMTFYTRPSSVHDMVEQSVKRMVDLLNLGIEEHDEDEDMRWSGFDWKRHG